MSLQTTVHWLASVPLSCFHAAEAVLKKQRLLNESLAGALAEPAEQLQAGLIAERVPPEVFWSHLLPLSINIDGHHRLAKVALTKTVGVDQAEARFHRICDLLTDVKNAFTAAVPELHEVLASSIEPLRQRWNYQGPGLLAGAANHTEPELLVEEATAVLVYPALGGGGNAHLLYNLASIEAVDGDVVPELPEVVRLGWLLSMLNLDLPRYCEHVGRDRLGIVAPLAMIPPILTAAAEVQLTAPCDDALIRQAVQHWLPALEKSEERTATLLPWWQTYLSMRTDWSLSLKALDLALDGTEPPSKPEA